MGGHPSKPNPPPPAPPPPLPLCLPPPTQPKSPTREPVREETEETLEERRQKSSPGQRKKFYKDELEESFEDLMELPHAYEEIVRQADVPTIEHLLEHKFSGVFLDQGRKRFWVDKTTGCNCFMLYARDLSITWGDDPRYWKWVDLQESSDVCIRVAALINVCWLEIHGRFEMSYLTPGTAYEVAFVVMMSRTSYGWKTPVNLRLTDPGGTVQTRLESLGDKPSSQWIELVVGELKTTPECEGKVETSMFEYADGAWKNGLVVKGICIRPRTSGTG